MINYIIMININEIPLFLHMRWVRRKLGMLEFYDQNQSFSCSIFSSIFFKKELRITWNVGILSSKNFDKKLFK